MVIYVIATIAVNKTTGTPFDQAWTAQRLSEQLDRALAGCDHLP